MPGTVGFAVNINSSVAANRAIFALLSENDAATTTSGLALVMNNTTLEVWRDRGLGVYSHSGGHTGFDAMSAGGTLVGSSGTFERNTWYYIEVKFKLTNAPDGYVYVRVNQTPVVSYTGVTAATYRNISHLHLGLGGVQNEGPQPNSSYVDFDDIYLADLNGSTNNNFLNPISIQKLLPNANNSTAWTPNTGTNFAAVDETNPDFATTYIETSTNNAKDVYDFTDLAGSGTIKGVEITMIAQKTGGAGQITPVVKPVSTEYNQAIKSVNGVNTWDGYRWIVENNPETSGSFTTAELNATKFGVIHNG
jgi:hypothetical protein